MICGTGWRTLVRGGGGQHSPCLCYVKRVSRAMSQPYNTLPYNTHLTSHRREFSQRFKSSAALLRTMGQQGSVEGKVESSGDKVQAAGDGRPQRKPIRVGYIYLFFMLLENLT